MKPAWPTKKIGEVCTLATGGTPSRSSPEYFEGGRTRWLVSGDIHRREIFDCAGRITALGLANSNARPLPLNSVIIALNGQGKTRGTVAILRTEATCNQSLVSINPNRPTELLPEFLFWNLHARYEEIRRITGDDGNDRRGLNMPLIRNIEIPLPPLENQRRIVTKLDEAFAVIAIAIANTEKKVSNVRLLMDVYLRKRFASIDAKIAALGDLADFRNGLNFSGRSKGEKVSIVGVKDFQNNLHVPANRLAMVQIDGQLSDQDILREGDILTVRSNGNKALIGRCMIAGPQSEKTSHSGFTIRIRADQKAIDPSFLCRILKSPDIRDRLVDGGGGANISSLNQKALANLPIPLPTYEMQRKMVTELDDIEKMAARLFELADKKLSALSALKQSILERAFTEELMTASVASSADVSSQFATPQFTAQVIAFAHHRHERWLSQKTFGHVKAQKALQLVESVGEIDLGRHPIKDAAGPNDFQHMLRATDWAAQNDFFEFVPRATGKGYDFKKLANFGSMMIDALAATRPVSPALERAIDPIVPMVSQDAEVFATVHAAWNNLLHDGKVASDDAIVKEARDDWHSAKLNIPERKFRAAIKFIREKGLVPDGSAKYVGGQGGLF